MKISAKELIQLLAQGGGGPDDLLPGQQWDVSEEELQKMIDEGVGLEPSGTGNLERAFESAGSPQRLRLIDPEGNLYDVFMSEATEEGTQMIGVQPLKLKVVYPSEWNNFASWAEAEANLPNGWEVYESIGVAPQEQQEQWLKQLDEPLKKQEASASRKWLVISNKGDKIQILKVIDEKDWD